MLHPGLIRFAFQIDLNGTPDDFSDDFMVDGSFRVVRESNGRTDTTGDFCEESGAVHLRPLADWPSTRTEVGISTHG